MKKMLFEPNLKGHRMEYIHHIYMGMVQHTEDEFVIVVPKEFENKKNLYVWPKVNNISFCFISENDLFKVNDENGSLKGSFRRTKLLRKYMRHEKVESILLISLMGYIPFLPILIPKRVNVCGIIYKIYFYRWAKSSFLKRFSDVMTFFLISRRNCIKNVFVLNDAPSARKFNNLFHTNKFCFITDPYNVLNYKPHDLRNKYSIPTDDRLFLHFGGLNRRKGTLLILDSIKCLNEDARSHSTFVFAGCIYEPIHDDFFRLVKELKPIAKIIVLDEFLTNEHLADLCFTSDFILAPYSVTTQSSGVLGHAAYFRKPVIGPRQGLVGKLIRRYKLGLSIKEITPVTLASSISDIKPYLLNTNYVEEITISNFLESIFKRF